MRRSLLSFLALSMLSLASCRDRLPSGPSDSNTVSQKPIAQYTFIGNYKDVTLHGHDGTLYPLTANAIQPFTADRFNTPNAALNLDGTDYVQVENKADLDFTGNDSYTINAWIRPSGTTRDSVELPIIAKGASNSHSPGYQFSISGDKLYVELTRSAADFVMAGTTMVTDGNWHLASLVVTANKNITLYVDGQVDRSSDASGLYPETNNSAPLFIGQDRTGQYHYNGALDDISIYNRALSQSEISTLYHENGWTGQTNTTGGFGPSGTQSNLTAIHFVDSLNGFACGFNGTIIRTTDGGASWTSSPTPTQENLYEISFAPAGMNVPPLDPARVGVAGGNNGVILRTTDGGVTWVRLQNVPLLVINGIQEVIRDIRFVDQNSIIAVGGAGGAAGFVIESTDRGDSWIRLTMPDGTTSLNTSLYGIHAIDLNTMTFVGNGGTVLLTTDGGVTWASQTLNAVTLFDIDETAGIPGTIIVGRGIAVGTGGTAYVTTNGGGRWTPVKTGVTSDLRCVQMVSHTEAWIAGDGGVILHTLDGGNTWSQLTVGQGVRLSGIGLRDATHRVFCGDNGSLFWK